MAINYQDRIPNNVDLGNDRALQRALEHWQPRFIEWWKELGPEGFQTSDVYLRTATSVDSAGWATFGKVKMPDYRWGIFLADREQNRTIGFGDEYGKPAWQKVPGEHRATLRRLIVTQGDTEPASVEQQRRLGFTCPSLYDLRNLFQVNVEEGRHLWAMVYLLHAHFGRDGREEAEELLHRHSGDVDNPRILGTFNEPIDDWLSFFMFTYFTDRDGKYQLMSLAESAFDPLSRTCRFMLTEESHHMFVGETGITRVIRRALEKMEELKSDDPELLRKHGVIDLLTVQHQGRQWLLQLQLELHLLLGRGDLEALACGFQQLRDFTRLQLQLLLAALVAGEVEQVVDQPDQSLHFLVHGIEQVRFATAGRVAQAFTQQAEGHLHAGYRRAQLM